MTKEEKLKTIQILSGLRGIASLWVVLLHYTIYFKAGAIVPLFFFTTLIHSGYLGVDLFFILSGYVLSYQYCEKLDFSKRSLIRYGIRRFSRIYPMYFFTLIFVLFLDKSGILTTFVKDFGDFSREGFYYSLFLIQSWQIRDVWTWNMPSWTVSIEFLCYIIFPLFLFLIKKLRLKFLIILVFFLSIYFISITYFFQNMLYYEAMKYGIYRGLFEFLFGISAFFIFGGKRSSLKYNILLTTVIIMLVMLIYIGSNKGLWIICCFLIVSLFPLCGSGFLKKLMTSKPLIFLGKISYSLYLAQFSVQVILNRSYSYLDITSRPGSILFFFFGITLLVFVSFILYKFIESPIRKKLNKRTHLNGLNVIPSS